jgi:hypothetical protein
VKSCLDDVHLTTGGRDFVDTQFLSWELCVLGGSESGGHFVE